LLLHSNEYISELGGVWLHFILFHWNGEQKCLTSQGNGYTSYYHSLIYAAVSNMYCIQYCAENEEKKKDHAEVLHSILHSTYKYKTTITVTNLADTGMCLNFVQDITFDL